MSRILRNIIALLRGISFHLHYLFSNDCKIGKTLRSFRGSSIRISKGAKLTVGNNAKIDYNTVISVLDRGSLSIGDNVGIGPNSMIVCHNNIQIGNGTMFGPGSYIYDHDHLFSKEIGVMPKEFKYGTVKIGDNCWFGAGCIILRDTTVGDGCVIGAGTILKGNYPANSIITQHRDTCIRGIGENE